MDISKQNRMGMFTIYNVWFLYFNENTYPNVVIIQNCPSKQGLKMVELGYWISKKPKSLNLPNQHMWCIWSLLLNDSSLQILVSHPSHAFKLWHANPLMCFTQKSMNNLFFIVKGSVRFKGHS